MDDAGNAPMADVISTPNPAIASNRAEKDVPTLNTLTTPDP
jgi:hypothetical protein